MVLVVVGGFVGYDKARTVRATLVAADSLIASDADSAFSIISSLSDDDLWGGEQRAHYALIYTKSAYKSYQPLVSDSLISIAEKYYRLHDDKPMYAQASAFKGVTLMEMGLATEAIYYIKIAESLTDTTDLFTLGWLNLRLGELYQMTYADNGEHIAKFKKALNYLSAVDPHSTHTRYATSHIGQLYRSTDNDSALYYLGRAIELCKIEGYAEGVAYNTKLLCELYELMGEYEKSRELCLDVIEYEDELSIKNGALLCLSRVYSKMSEVDSASMVFGRVDQLLSLSDSINYWHTEYELKSSRGDHRGALESYVRAMVLDNNALSAARRHMLGIAERHYDSSRIEKQNEELGVKLSARNFWLVLISFVVILVVVAGVMIIRRKNIIARRNEEFIEMLQLESRVYSSTIDERLRNESHLRQVLGSQIESIKELLELAYRYDGNANIFMDKFKNSVRINKLSGSMWQHLRYYVNENYDGIIDYFQAEHSGLSDDDLNYISMMCCGFSYIEMTVCLGNSNERSTCNRRIRIAQRMGVAIPLDQYIEAKKKFLAERRGLVF